MLLLLKPFAATFIFLWQLESLKVEKGRKLEYSKKISLAELLCDLVLYWPNTTKILNQLSFIYVLEYSCSIRRLEDMHTEKKKCLYKVHVYVNVYINSMLLAAWFLSNCLKTDALGCVRLVFIVKWHILYTI